MPTVRTSLQHAKVLSKIVLDYLRQPRFRHFLRTVPFTLRAFTNSQRGEFRAQGPTEELSRTERTLTTAENRLQSYFESHAEGRGVWKWIHYFDIYHRHFSKFVGREVSIVEVGIYSGGSLQMWRDYFGPMCHVYAVDIEPACKIYENEFTKVFIGDQADRGFWERFKASVRHVDILVDDGGHSPEQQVVTLEEMLPHICPGGVYVCEDVQGVFHKFSAYLHGLAHSLNTWEASGTQGGKANNFQSAIGSIHLYPFVAVIEKTDAPVQEYFSIKHGTEWQPFSPRAKSDSQAFRTDITEGVEPSARMASPEQLG